MEISEVLSRIDGRLQAIDSRLQILERRVESIIAPPRALKLDEAANLLSIGRTTILEMVRSGQIRTVTIKKRKRIPLSEIVRLTAVKEKSPRAAPGVRRKIDPRSEAAKIRALTKKR